MDDIQQTESSVVTDVLFSFDTSSVVEGLRYSRMPGSSSFQLQWYKPSVSKSYVVHRSSNTASVEYHLVVYCRANSPNIGNLFSATSFRGQLMFLSRDKLVRLHVTDHENL